MEQRLANTWRMTVNEKNFIQSCLLSDLRVDGRRPFDYRRITIKFGREDGSAVVQLGQTHVMGFVTSQLVQPYRDRPNEGTLAVYTEFSPMADPSFEAGRPGEFAVELGRIIDRGLRESRAVDTESLCVVAGKLVWAVRIDLHIIDNGGNLVDAANVAALAALSTFRRPECTLGGEDGQEVIIHPPEVESFNTERALRKIKRHTLSAAVDVSEPTQKGVGEISKNHMERLKLVAEESNDMEVDTQSSGQDKSSRRDGDAKSFIGGPSSWDPYSKGIDSDALRASLASRGEVAQTKKVEDSKRVMPDKIELDQPPADIISAASVNDTSTTEEPTNGEKTLKDAIKPKHKRKKKASSSATASWMNFSSIPFLHVCY